VTERWSDVADVLLEAALHAAVERLHREGVSVHPEAAGFAIFALGRLGGRDLHFKSDLDLLYVYDEAMPREQAERLGQVLGEILQAPLEEGRLFEVDLRLRPEGRQGPAVTGLAAARRYYGDGGRAETWEFQTLTRLRRAAGDRDTAAAFADLVEPRMYRSPFPEAWRGQIAAMRQRMATERVSESQQGRHLKLGPGGLADIEFLLQYLQLRHGAELPALRETMVDSLLQALRSHALLGPEETAILLDAYRFLTRVRQALYLLRGEGAPDVLPDPQGDPRLARALTRALDEPDPAAVRDHFDRHTTAVREIYRRHLE
jgi:[glutamine synthetase] adenylyltransferase / [glutamine synthetase]-adenylyl-L-tyrosine phosphorylase